MKRLLILALGGCAVAAAALAQGMGGGNVTVQRRPSAMTPDDPTQTYHIGPYNSTTGALLDAGYVNDDGVVNPTYKVSVEGAAALFAAECEARMLRDGINNARSNVFSFGDDPQGRRMSRVVVMSATLDAGVPISQSGNPTASLFWRPLAGGDAGMPWMRMLPVSTGVLLATAQTGATPSAGLFVNVLAAGEGNGGTPAVGNTDIWAPGYYCLLPSQVPGYGVSHIWVRINRMFEPR